MKFDVETTEVDFKEKVEIKQPKSWLKSVSAFANGIGGVLYFGIDKDTHEVVGLENVQYNLEKISEIIKAHMSPVPKIKLTKIEQDNKDIIRLEVKSDSNTPYYYSNHGSKEAFVRIGNRSEQCPNYRLNELIAKGTRNSYDAMLTNKKIEDLSFTLLNATYIQRCNKSFNNTDFQSFGLADADGYLTNAGLLFADICPLRHSRIFCTRWTGNTMTTINDETVDSKEFSGNLIQLLQNGLDFIKLHNRVSWYKTGRGRVETSEYPDTATYEILVNGLIHRSYDIIGSEVHIDMFDNRIEITSPRWYV